MAPKVRRSKLPESNSAISEAKQTAQKFASELINFSFKYLTEQNEKFQCYREAHVYYHDFLKRIKALSTLKIMEFLSNRSDALRAHPIVWEKTTEKKGFGIPAEDQIVDTPYQFTLSANENGRIHGFFIQNTFYIVWFDKDHALYS